MSANISIAKEALRRQMRARLRGIVEIERMEASARLCNRLHALEDWRAADCILFFAPLSDEPDIFDSISRALREGKEAALLRFQPHGQQFEPVQIKNPDQDLVAGHFGVREPAAHCPLLPMKRLDLLLVPGLAFDPRGHRLGRGKGFYDRLLGAARGTKCGICFDEQVAEMIPVEAHDVAVNCVVTPTRWLKF
jgi:5-formyltetrahydrofolate cyclo-ligase